MDKNKIKSFAIWARRKLISSVSERANRIGVTEKTIEEAVVVQGGFKLEGNEEIFKLSKEHRDKLVNEVKEKGFEQVMEEVAYTWFNRFMGLRYMEVNDYLPTGIRVLSSIVEGKTEPDVLTRVSEVIDELKLKVEYIYELLDSGKTADREEAYKYILVRQCNELGKIIPQMFEKISDYTELLLPDNLLEEGSVIRRMVEDISEDNWKEEVEIIGWMYQYYISEKKDEVFAALKNNIKITKENIPAATQLFTPKWIVKYMVENSLGKLWLEGHPNEELKKEWKYYLEEVQQEPEVEEELKNIREEHSKLKPEDIKVLDPCMGSGHILVYAFDLLYEIYKNVGYSEREIPRLILQNNLYGLDIDDRAAQLASFALIMKARHYNRRLFREIEREHLELNLCSIQESNEFIKGLGKEAIDYFVGDNEELRKDINYLIDVFTDAKEYGSILEVEGVNFEALKQRLSEIENEDKFIFADFKNSIREVLSLLIKQTEIMSMKYDICVTNPPYMGRKGMNLNVLSFLDENYKTSKNDLYAVFIEKSFKFIKRSGFSSMVTMHSWMFLSTFKEMRMELINNFSIESILHLGMEGFEGIIGKVVQTVAFVIRKERFKNIKPVSIRLVDFYDSKRYEKENQFFNKKYRYSNITQNDFKRIPGHPIAYWMSNKFIDLFAIKSKLNTIGELKSGVSSNGENDKLFRLWFEVDNNKIEKKATHYNDIKNKWLLMNKGGAYRRWYGNLEYVCDNIFCPRNDKEFDKAITWGDINGNHFSARLHPKGIIANNVGKRVYIDEHYYNYVLGFMNTIIAEEMLNLIIPTIHFDVGYVGNLPIINPKESENNYISNLVKENIQISKEEWDSFETSLNYKTHTLLGTNAESKMQNVLEQQLDTNERKFSRLKNNEEQINKKFIEIYDLGDQLEESIKDEDISFRRVNQKKYIKLFISYAIGCILGRYSIDTEGLIYAGGEFKDKWNLEEGKVRKIVRDEEGNVTFDSWVDATFLPDDDNVIPITEDEYFEDDIVARFIEFAKTVYGEATLEENLDFIADSIGRKPSETSRQAIRRYFVKDFYKEHLKVYQKRPIYWLFESGKNDGFKALVYMHRYNAQTVAKVRTDYLHTLQRKYEAEVQRQQLIVDSEEYAVKDRTFAKKKIDRISKQIEECREYDQVVAHLANEKISIDLDDGVKVNYEQFQGVKFINSKEKEVKMDLLAKI